MECWSPQIEALICCSSKQEFLSPSAD
jgi:hypothetical protein